MKIKSYILKPHVVKALILAVGLSCFSTTETIFAYGWHHHYWRRADGFGPGIFIGAAFGFLAGAAIADSSHYYYAPPYYGCERVVYTTCRTYFGFYGPYRRCYRRIGWTC